MLCLSETLLSPSTPAGQTQDQAVINLHFSPSLLFCCARPWCLSINKAQRQSIFWDMPQLRHTGQGSSPCGVAVHWDLNRPAQHFFFA